MEYEINYKIVSAFSAQVEANSEEEARAKFLKIDMKYEVSENILDGGLDHSEIEIENIDTKYKESN